MGRRTQPLPSLSWVEDLRVQATAWSTRAKTSEGRRVRGECDERGVHELKAQTSAERTRFSRTSSASALLCWSGCPRVLDTSRTRWGACAVSRERVGFIGARNARTLLRWRTAQAGRQRSFRARRDGQEYYNAASRPDLTTDVHSGQACTNAVSGCDGARGRTFCRRTTKCRDCGRVSKKPAREYSGRERIAPRTARNVIGAALKHLADSGRH